MLFNQNQWSKIYTEIKNHLRIKPYKYQLLVLSLIFITYMLLSLIDITKLLDALPKRSESNDSMRNYYIWRYFH
jgi:hypothetical protein